MLTGKYKDAIASALKGLKINPDDAFLKMNLAHGYLLDGRYDNAFEIHKQNKDGICAKGESWKAVCLENFEKLRNAGRDHPDMKKIEAFLENNTTAKE